ncbi:MAG: tagaturonate reductase [Bacilli bacterium]|nr:tagaturonate reductase [Bacilli bacterium]
METIRIAQFGEGNFLRTFVDAYFDTLNKEGADYRVTIIKPITFGNLEAFKKQNNKYHIVLRGMDDGEAVENVYEISSIENTIDPFADEESFYSLAVDPTLKMVVSNTTEAGIVFKKEDKMDDELANISYPAKLTKFLLKRYEAGLPGLYLLPVELIPDNGEALEKAVSSYIELWGLDKGFKEWNETKNHYCSTLVDRIVSGHPRDEATQAHINCLIGEDDALSSIGEPFGLWVVENKGDVSSLIKDGRHNIDVVISNNVAYYKKRKVRVLNGSHTNLVPLALLSGKVTVYDCMVDSEFSRFVDDTLKFEIVPFVSDDIAETTKFADSVKDRFMNPYLNHQLTSISLNSVSKWKERVLPSFKDYYKANGKIPNNIVKGFAGLVALYSRIRKDGGRYVANVPGREIELKDDARYLEYFANKGSIKGFMEDTSIWGEDLTEYNDFLDAVTTLVEFINKGDAQ